MEKVTLQQVFAFFFEWSNLFQTYEPPFHIDLLQFGPLKSMMLWSGFPYLFQLVTLVLFVGFAVVAWGLFPPDGVADKLFAKTNLVNLVIWGLWWPAMVVTAVMFGRVWCMICPLELVANLCQGVAREPILGGLDELEALRCGRSELGLHCDRRVVGEQCHAVVRDLDVSVPCLLAGRGLDPRRQDRELGGRCEGGNGLNVLVDVVPVETDRRIGKQSIQGARVDSQARFIFFLDDNPRGDHRQEALGFTAAARIVEGRAHVGNVI